MLINQERLIARLPRFVIPGQPQHVIVRGNNREPIFYQEADYYFYLEKLKAAALQHELDIHAYVLMTNHVHLLVTPQQDRSISKAMQMIGRYYVQYFNHVHDRTGTLWEGRYKATLIDSERYLLTCMRYIELNPVRADMVDHPSEYPWSSYLSNAAGKTNDLLTPHREYKRMDRSAEKRQQRYRALFRAQVPRKDIDDIREATNKAWVLGSDRFKKKIEKQLNRAAQPKQRGGDHKSASFKRETEINGV